MFKYTLGETKESFNAIFLLSEPNHCMSLLGCCLSGKLSDMNLFSSKRLQLSEFLIASYGWLHYVLYTNEHSLQIE